MEMVVELQIHMGMLQVMLEVKEQGEQTISQLEQVALAIPLVTAMTMGQLRVLGKELD
jgi:hypothetical protein